MRLALNAIVVCFASAIAGGSDTADAKKLQGSWRVTAVEIDGRTQPADKTPKMILISGNKLTGVGPEMALSLDATKRPKWIDLTFVKGDKAYPLKAIYELDDDELRLCMPLAKKGIPFENTRPETFDTMGKDVVLFRAVRLAK